MNRFFGVFARRAAEVIGSPWVLALVVALLGLWIVTGLHFGFSAVWLSIFGTSTSTASLIMVLLIQATQHRDTKAIHLKLDELLRAVATARTDLVHLEHRSDEELAAIQQEFADVCAEDRADGANSRGDQDPPARAEEPRATV